MNIVVVTAPPFEPVSLADIYTWLHIDPEDSPQTHPDDDMITGLIQAAREKVEQETSRALIEQRLHVLLPCFPSTGGVMQIPRPPLVGVHSVTYYDADNALQTLTASDYFVCDELEPAELRLADGATWPITFERADAVRIEFTAGYPVSASPPSTQSEYAAGVPEAIKTAIKYEVQLSYDAMAVDQRERTEATISRLLSSFRIRGV